MALIAEKGVALKKQAKQHDPLAADFDVVTEFFGYRNKEDPTALPPGYLVVGSKNVFMNTQGLAQTRPGYSLYGQAGVSGNPILSSFDWNRHTGDQRNLRAGNSKLQLAYTASAGDYYNGLTFTQDQVYWIDLLDSLDSNYWNFATFWDNTTEKTDFLLGVNRSSDIYEWSGGLATLASAYSTAILLTGNSALLTAAALGHAGAEVVVVSNEAVGTSFRGGIILTSNPSDGDSVTLILNATSIVIHFVSVIGAVAGNVLIGATTADTITNLLGLLNAPATTNATQVALSGPNQTLVGYLTSTSTGAITKNGTSTWAQEGFYLHGTRSVTINGTEYAYTAGENTTTLLGVTPAPGAEPVNSVIFQTIRVTANGSMSGIPSTLRNDLISNLNNQIYVASLLDNNIYVSKVDDYQDYSYTTPVRTPGEGARLTLDGAAVSLIPQDVAMYISCGQDFWFQTVFTLSADLMAESLTVKKLKTSPLNAALSQGLTVNMLNDVAFLTREPTFNTLGNVQNVFVSPQTVNLSDSIKNDFDTYTLDGFTDGTAIYHRYFMYVSVPTLGIVRVYNLSKGWWEAPWNIPVACFSIINGALYGHSYLNDESYKLLDGTNDNGNPIDSVAAFSYQNFGARGTQKHFTEFYLEGYISSNTTLSVATKFDFGGVGGIPVYYVQGNSMYTNSIGQPVTIPLFFTSADGSIGRNPIGSQPIGSITDSPSNLPKFRIIFTGVPQDFFEYQAFFETNDVDFQWQILAFGPKIQRGNEPSYVTL